MSSNGAVETSALAGVACNAILYIVRLSLNAIDFRVLKVLLISRSSSRDPSNQTHLRILISAVLAQFFFSTTYITLQFFMTFQSFVGLQLYPPSPPTALLSLHASEVRYLSGWSSPPEPRPPIALYWLNTHAKYKLHPHTHLGAPHCLGLQMVHLHPPSTLPNHKCNLCIPHGRH
ncbi:hypothetical protein BDQ17DRAFT_1345959 [Cyathus striatus]|nr:hypothetical protein BDQ17DRAFT_1345959 [Cyathus striatus]